MKNKHPKRKLANKMLSKIERKVNMPVFYSKAWEDRIKARKQKVAKLKKRLEK